MKGQVLHRERAYFPSVSVVQLMVQMSKFNGLGKTHRERVFVVELKLNFVRPFSTNKLFEKINLLNE